MKTRPLQVPKAPAASAPGSMLRNISSEVRHLILGPKVLEELKILERLAGPEFFRRTHSPRTATQG